MVYSEDDVKETEKTLMCGDTESISMTEDELLHTKSSVNDDAIITTTTITDISDTTSTDTTDIMISGSVIKPTPLPKSIIVICMVLFSESFVASMLFPFVAFMVRDFGVASSDADVGYYSGFLASAFFLGQFTSGFFWGYLSDKYGRRPILLIGLFGSGVSMLGFGLSYSYIWAICCRSFGGLMNSNFSIARSWIGDMTDPSNRVRGFSMVGLMWGAGSIVGPLLGGVLSKPAETEDSFFVKYPYILPSFVGAGITAVALVTTYFFLPESRKSVLEKKKAEVEMKDVMIDGAGIDGTLPAVDEETLLGDTNGDRSISHEEGDYGFDEVDLSSPPKENIGFMNKLVQKMWKPQKEKDYVKMRQEKILEGEKKKSGISIVFKSRSVLAACLLICLQGASVVAIDDLFPLWAMMPPPAGLGFSSSQIGLAWSIGGAAMLIFQAFIYTRLIGWLSPLGGVRWGSFLFVFVYILYAFLTPSEKFPKFCRWIWVALGGVLAGRYVAGSTCGTTLNIILNTVGGPEVQKHRGAVNGFSMSLRGAAMAASPFMASSIFAWSIGNGLGFPFDHYFEFIVSLIINPIFSLILNLAVPC